MILNCDCETQSNETVDSPLGGPLGVPEYNIMETKFRVVLEGLRHSLRVTGNSWECPACGLLFL